MTTRGRRGLLIGVLGLGLGLVHDLGVQSRPLNISDFLGNPSYSLYFYKLKKRLVSEYGQRKKKAKMRKTRRLTAGA